MAWLRSEQSLAHHPKTKLLQSYLNTTLPETIGRLHLLWYWCLDYALDGDLSRKEAKMIEQSCDIPLKLLIRAGFVDSRPYRRIHDWWQIQGNYLKIRFRDQPDNWHRIRDLYEKSERRVQHMGTPMGNTVGNPMDVSHGRTDVRRIRTDDTDVEKKESASRPAPGGASAPLAEEERMTPEEMKAIRIRNMGEW